MSFLLAPVLTRVLNLFLDIVWSSEACRFCWGKERFGVVLKNHGMVNVKKPRRIVKITEAVENYLENLFK